MDIKRLYKEYVYVNDPRVRQGAIRFSATFVAIVAVTGLLYAAATLGPGNAADPDPSNGFAAEAAHGPEGATTECVPADHVGTWYDDHPDKVVTGQVVRADGTVCLTYQP